MIYSFFSGFLYEKGHAFFIFPARKEKKKKTTFSSSSEQEKVVPLIDRI